MAVERNAVKVTAESDLETLLDEAAMSPVILERRGVIYRLSRIDDHMSIKQESNRERELRMLDETIGSWADLDIDRIIREIYDAREAGSRPPDRP